MKSALGAFLDLHEAFILTRFRAFTSHLILISQSVLTRTAAIGLLRSSEIMALAISDSVQKPLFILNSMILAGHMSEYLLVLRLFLITLTTPSVQLSTIFILLLKTITSNYMNVIFCAPLMVKNGLMVLMAI